jgi:hypothetical protein
MFKIETRYLLFILGLALILVLGIYPIVQSRTPAQAPDADDGVPAGAVMFFNATSCPTGWAELTDARGRYLVGLTDPAIWPPGAMVGTALSNEEERLLVGRHDHNVTDNGHTHRVHDPGHGHSLTDPEHTHVIVGHQHLLPASLDFLVYNLCTSDCPSGSPFGDYNAAEPRFASQMGGGKYTESESTEPSPASTGISLGSNTTGLAILSRSTGLVVEEEGVDGEIDAPYLQLLVCEKVEE